MPTMRYTLGDLVPVSVAATVLQRSVKQVYRLIEEGQLRSVQLGPRAMMVERDSLIERLQKRNDLSIELHGNELVVITEDAADRKSA